MRRVIVGALILYLGLVWAAGDVGAINPWEVYNPPEGPAASAGYAPATAPPTAQTFYYADFQSGAAEWAPFHYKEQSGVYWQYISDYDDGNGARTVMWCGVDDPAMLAASPGYGNDWIQDLSKDFVLPSGTVTMTYMMQHDTEDTYDPIIIGVSDDGGATFTAIEWISGWSDGFVTYVTDLSAYAGQAVTVRFRFISDYGLSDQADAWFHDPGYPGYPFDYDGACRLDWVEMTGFARNNFDTGGDGWVASVPNTADWGAFRIEETPACAEGLDCPNYCYSWVAYDPVTGQFPQAPQDLLGQGQGTIFNFFGIESPVITIPDDGASYYLEFDVYDDLPISNAIFYGVDISSPSSENGGYFQSQYSIYYNQASTGFTRMSIDITPYVQPGATEVKVRVIALDYTEWYGTPGAPHNAGPMFDNVAILVDGSTAQGIDITGSPSSCVPTGNTESGSNVAVTPEDPGNVTITFASTEGGETSVTTSQTGPPPLDGFKLGSPPMYYDVSTTATFSGDVQVCINYDETAFSKETGLELFHQEDGHWVPVTTSLDADANIICGTVSSFSLFTVFEAIEYWSDVSASSGANDAGDSQGAAWGDYDGDGWDDIAIAGWRTGVQLYHNDGDGTFTSVHSTVLDETNWGSATAVSWGDYDNDGDLDLYIAADDTYEPASSRLLRNEGDGTFANATTAPADAAPDGHAGPWVDMDNDGYLDIYRGGIMLRGLGDGNFEDVTTYPLDYVGPGTHTVAWGDYDNDGDQDVFKNRYHGAGYLLTNDGCSSFSRGAGDVDTQPAVKSGCYGAEWGDYDNDGWLDLYRIQYNQPNHLYRNTGDGRFEDVTTAPLDFNGPSRDMTWVDFDNDGDLDIFLMVMDAPNKLLRNDGGGVWVEDTPTPLDENGMRGTIATADYDHDGDVDIYITGAWLANKLYRNNLDNGNHWLHVDLVGTVSNAAALGARITVEAGGVSQIRELTGGDHSQNSLTAEFGLGVNTAVDNVIVQWPSGIVTSTGPIGTIDQTITLTESGTANDIVCEFERVIGGPEFSISSMPNGAAWGDYDNDGDEDIFSVANPGDGLYKVSLYGNDGYGALADVTPLSLQDYQSGWLQSYTWIDYDNDGDLDLHYIAWTLPDRMYENDGAGDFVDVSTVSGLDDPGGAINAVWADYDNDGWVDCYIVKHGWNTMYRNLGDGTFVNVTNDNIELRATGNDNAAMFGDYDNDGDQDLFVCSETGNHLLRNDAGTFVEWLDPSHPLVTIIRHSGVMWGDYDNDGWLDLAMTGRNGLSLFHNDAGVDFSLASMPNDVVHGQDVSWVDYNNDGWLDLYVTCGGIDQNTTMFEPNALFRNNADGTFTNVAYGAVLNTQGGAGAVWADFDNDGDQDVFMNTRYWARSRMVRNLVGTDNHWLQFKLVGKVSNAAAIGARVVVEADGLSMIREVNGGSGNSGQNSLRAAFGLGSALSATVTVQWPSGIVQNLGLVVADQILIVEEPTIGSVVGRVYGDCPEAADGLHGVTIDAFEIGTGLLAGSDTTDTGGYYMIDSLNAGDFMMTIVTPLGYDAGSEEIPVTVLYDDTVTADFAVTCTEVAGNPRGIGFWKHQVGVATGGKGKAHIDAATLCDYLDLIEEHFNSNVINQVIVYEPPTSDLCDDKLLVAKDLINLKGKVAMVRRAKQHFMSLLFNVASNKLGLREEISEDHATLSQAITFVDSLVTDDDESNDERAKDIAEMINSSETVPAGWVPLTTPDIAYAPKNDLPVRFDMPQNYPNPFNPQTTIRFDLPEAVDVTLKVYDVTGRLVATLVDRAMSEGVHTVDWDGVNNSGSRVASGVYLVRIDAGAFTKTMRMVILK